MKYSCIYNKRLNRFGDTFASRVQGQREADFADYKDRSTYRVDFDYEDEVFSGVLEPNKQDETETTSWLLVDLNTTFNGGTVLEINTNHWMIMYQKQTESKGYNKFMVLRLTHLIKWKDRQGIARESWGYFFGKMDRIIYDVMRSTAKNPDYQDPNKETHIIMPKTEYLKRQDYLLIDDEGYYVTGYDLSSTPGVEYFSLKQTYERVEEDKPEGSGDDFFWLSGGSE